MESRFGTRGAGTFAQRLATETKQAFKTTEFWAFLVILIGLWIAGAVTGGGDVNSTTGTGSGGADSLPAGKVWLYTVILAVGYMVARGLAKAGSRDPYWDEAGSAHEGGSLADRVRTAAHVLKEGDVPGSEGDPTRRGGSTGAAGESTQTY
jgi:hypothetical protein